jgi:hypothetical protein
MGSCGHEQFHKSCKEDMKLGIILPDHGGREELIDLAWQQIGKQTVRPDAIYHIGPGHIRPSGSIDLVARLKMGCQHAKEDGIDFVLIIEDDFYGPDYIARFIPYMNFDFVGQDYTYYYQLKQRAWARFDHKYRSSLFTTGFKVSALNNWNWDDLRPDMAMVDIRLWGYAKRRTKAFIDTGAIGIKHGIGLCGGKGNLINMKNKDPEMLWLKEKVSGDAFEFYRELSERL